MAQTYTNFELILVDDGSPDNCPQICDDYAKKDKRIKVIHKENAGVSEARNTGLDIAKGDYIGFVDSDDYIEKDMYEKMLTKIEKTNADVAMCKLNFVYDNGVNKFLDEVDLKRINKDNIISFFLQNNCIYFDNRIEMKGVTWAVWRCLYSNKLIGKTRFINIISEDFLFNIEFLSRANRFAIVDKGYYNYFQRMGSITKAFNLKKIEQRMEFTKVSLNFILGKVTNEEFAAFSFYLYESIVIECLNARDYKELLKEIKNDNFLKSLNNLKNCKARMKNLTNKKKKLSCILIYLKWFWLYRKLYFKHRNTK